MAGAEHVGCDQYGPLSQPYLAFELSDPAIPEGVASLACPVLGIGVATHPRAMECDVVVPERSRLVPVIANITATPIAATVLVQLLRAIERLPPGDSLVMESLAYAALQGGQENRHWLARRVRDPTTLAASGPAVLVEREADRLLLTLNRPRSHNEITIELRDALTEALRLAALDPSIGAVVLRGAGKCFSVGGALAEFGSAPDQAIAHAVRCMGGPAFALATVAARARAVVHGACIGAGAELASLCGHITASPTAWFQLPEIRYGLLPGSGGTVGFSRRIGRQRTAYLALSARRIGARQALEWGLVDAVDMVD